VLILYLPDLDDCLSDECEAFGVIGDSIKSVDGGSAIHQSKMGKIVHNKFVSSQGFPADHSVLGCHAVSDEA